MTRYVHEAKAGEDSVRFIGVEFTGFTYGKEYPVIEMGQLGDPIVLDDYGRRTPIMGFLRHGFEVVEPKEPAAAKVAEPDTKPSNPKDAVGASKTPAGLVPDTVMAEASMAFLEGALKYGRYNWRAAGVRASIYNDAMERHRAKWWNGEDRDPMTRVKHLANIIACAGILLDAELCGKLTDDRPPRAPIAKLFEDQGAVIAHLKTIFAECDPHQYTIEDSAA